MTDKTPVQKLLLKEDLSLLLINPPADYEVLLGQFLVRRVSINQVSGMPNAILVFLDNRASLEEYLPKILPLLTSKTLLWLCYHKGSSHVKTDINRDTINTFCKTKGLQGVAIISIDDDWSSLRLKPIA